MSNSRRTGDPVLSSGGALAPASRSVAAAAPFAGIDPKELEIRVALRVVVLLSRVTPLEPGDTAPSESTQQGLASKLGVTQGAVSKVLQRLTAADVVRHARHHVMGRSRRMQAYFLTARGLDLARRYQESATDDR